MNTLQARISMELFLVQRGYASPGDSLFDDAGQATFRSSSGVECLLWIPEGQTCLYFYAPVLELTYVSDATLLAEALALNLNPALTQGGALALNPANGHLLLRHALDMAIDADGLERQMEAFLSSAGELRERFQRAQQAPVTDPTQRPIPPFNTRLQQRQFR
ncbi:CesT family type III secretion system chaperone [Pokkaliibacter plantistimulans]|uniref:CesT family type III secretion system chaperone n=1 Tax=Pokkaliibacter plantistimulans TaxID=1635171 RepID=UPI000D74705C|nr:CesT family type III secretion system chaperone [Pokkaliibacter plantistimulans]